MTVQEWQRHVAKTGETLHVFLDGVDVTRGCIEADAATGTVVLLQQRDDHGRAPLNRGEVATVTKRGVVRIEAGEAFV